MSGRIAEHLDTLTALTLISRPTFSVRLQHCSNFLTQCLCRSSLDIQTDESLETITCEAESLPQRSQPHVVLQ